MIVVITALIIALCFIGAAVAFSLTEQSGKGKKWRGGDELLPSQMPYTHVDETGPDSSFPLGSGNAVRETSDPTRKEN